MSAMGVTAALFLFSASSPVTAEMVLGQNILWFGECKGCHNDSYAKSGTYFKQGVDFGTTDDPWLPAVVPELQQSASVLRMMDAGMIASPHNKVTSWNDRRKKTDAYQWPDWSPNGTKGMAEEWKIDLATKVGADLWLNIPRYTVTAAMKDDPVNDYSVRLALLVKTGVDTTDVNLLQHLPKLSSMTADDLVALGGKKTIAPLPDGQKVYLEYANENWLEMWDWQTEQANQLGLGDTTNFSAWAAIQVWDSFATVFGNGSSRVVNIIAGQAASTHHCYNHLKVVANKTLNPKGYSLQGYAIAPYCGRKNDTIADIISFIPTAVDWTQKHKALLAPTSVPLLAYEGGQQIFPDPNHLNDQPAMGGFYTKYWAAMAPLFDGVFNHYGYANHMWGLKRYPGQPESEAHKWAASKPWFPGAAPRPVPRTPTPGSFSLV